MKSAIILAGGKGARFNGQKQFIDLCGKPLWRHVYDKASKIALDTVVVGVDIPGGETRTDSVIAGLFALSPLSKRVIILEAARPLVSEQQINTLLDSESDSCTFSLPMVETILIGEYTYPDRKMCVAFQTPQAFGTSKLIEAYCSGKYVNMTDETRVMWEHFGIAPTLFTGGENLYKVTYPYDLEVIRGIMERLEIHL